MPFDGSGNFSRLYNWQSDRDNGIRVLASRMDGEFDNFASGMNQVFFRNGLVPMSGNLNMGQNYITGLASGNVNTPSMRFADDPSSGMFLNGFNRPALVVAGVNRLEANTGGVNVTGSLLEGGSRVWTAATLNTANLAPKDQPTFTGSATSPLFLAYVPGGGRVGVRAGAATGTGFIEFLRPDGGRRGYMGNISDAASSFEFVAEGGTSRFDFHNAQVYNLGHAVWHAGNFNPGNYATLGGSPTFTGGELNVRAGSNGWTQLTSGSASRTGSAIFYNSVGVRQGYIGNVATNGPIEFGSDTGGGFTFSHHVGFQQSIGVAGALQVTGAMTGSSTLSVAGTITAPSHRVDGNFYIGLSGGQPLVNFDDNDYILYNRADNQYLFHVAGRIVMRLDPNGNLRVRGNIIGNAGDGV